MILQLTGLPKERDQLLPGRVNVYTLLLKMAIEIEIVDDLPIKHGDFPSFFGTVYQAGYFLMDLQI